MQSSGERKNTCVPLSIHNIITPQAQISIAEMIFFIHKKYKNFLRSPSNNYFLIPEVCDGCFSKTSGGRNPGVPARGAVCDGFVKHNMHTLGFPKQ